MTHMSPAAAAIPAPSRPLARLVPLALTGVIVTSVVFVAVLPIVARASDVVPVNEGSALVQTEGTLLLNRTTVAGPVSVGGDLASKRESRIGGGAVEVPRVAGGSRAVQLFVGGAPAWDASSDELLVDGPGDIAVMDLSQTDVDDAGTDTVLTPRPPSADEAGAVGEAGPAASIRGTADETADEGSAADLDVDTAATFDGYRERSDKLSTCEQTVTVDEDGIVALQPGITNVWNVTEEYIDHQLVALNLSPAPSADTKLIVNITASAGASMSLPWGMSDDISSHVLYNFVGEGQVTFAGNRGIRGTVYAPGFDITTGNPGVIQGNVIARSFQVAGRGAGLRIQDYPFLGPVLCNTPSSSSPLVVPSPGSTPVATTTTRALPGAVVTVPPAGPAAAGEPVPPGGEPGVAGADDPAPSGAATSAAGAGATAASAAGAAGSTSLAASLLHPGVRPVRIAFTGADVAGMVLTALGLLAAGIGMTWTTRRQNAAGRHIA